MNDIVVVDDVVLHILGMMGSAGSCRLIQHNYNSLHASDYLCTTYSRPQWISFTELNGHTFNFVDKHSI